MEPVSVSKSDSQEIKSDEKTQESKEIISVVCQPVNVKTFAVDRNCIPTVIQDEQEEELNNLDIQVYHMEVLEKGILQQVGKAFEEQKKLEEFLKQEKLSNRDKQNPIYAEGNNEDVPKEVFTDCVETEKEKKIRMGEMTPFGTVISSNLFEKNVQPSDDSAELPPFTAGKGLKRKLSSKLPPGKKIVRKQESFSAQKRHEKEILGSNSSNDNNESQKEPDKVVPLSEVTFFSASGSEFEPADSDPDDSDFELKSKQVKIKRKPLHKKVKKSYREENSLQSDSDCDHYISGKTKGEKDDGDEINYLLRIEDWEKKCNRDEIETQLKVLDNSFKVPLIIWNKLYNYQKVGVQWLWELNMQRCGGILGDEMGLGKTIQVISFLSGLSVSKLTSRHGSFYGLGPVLIVCPTTVMHQWVKEFHQWWPQFRVALLHESGTYIGKKTDLVRDIVKKGGILITSYVTCVQKSECLLRYTWHYVILDEGHKIRNPDSQIASTVKLLKTPHRLILSGSPMQNNLKELWSLFDFIFPGKLGSLPVFTAEFGVPITQGGYANASKIQVATAFKCATVLRDTISPYLLRRVKDDVKTHINLPQKNEQVLFCRLTEEQKDLYVNYLNSGKVDDILSGKYKVFVGLIELRKICNHPHLYTGGPKLLKTDIPELLPEENKFGYWKKAGKMIVIETLLKLWKKQGHRVLIFTQSRKMLLILEAFVSSQNYNYIKIDGSTNISRRQPLIQEYNSDKKYFVFLSTTHVGGLGVNLTGANRVVIYDPDWNPATDMQARERAWRIGQENQVTIYRLVTSGTIEEKIYHRQIFKQFLTNKVLKDPSQKRFFKSNDLYELFTYKDSKNTNETSAIFAGTGAEINLRKLSKARNQKRKLIKDKINLEPSSVKTSVEAQNILTKEKIEKMKQMAQSLSRKIGEELCQGQKNVDVTNNSIKDEFSPNSDKKNSSENLNSFNGLNEDSKLVNLNVYTTNENKQKRKKNQKNRDALFDGEIVPHLQKQMQYRDVIKEATDNENDDDYILKKLFSKSGVHAALKYDQIMESDTSDLALIEGEAEKVAKEAVKALKESRIQYLKNLNESQTSSVTSKPRFGRKPFIKQSYLLKGNGNEKNIPMSSAELLQRIHQRNGLCPVISSLPGNPMSDNSELLADIRNFISFGAEIDGKATTQEIVNKFRDRLPTSQTPLFKALLTEICDFRRTSSGEGMWELLPDFRW